MYYLKSLFLNFLAIFFANHIMPGILVLDQTKLPHLGGDLMFAAALGLLNSFIYPLLKLTCYSVTIVRIGLTALFLNFVVYGLLKLIPIGIEISSMQGYLIPAAVVTLVSILTNFSEMKRNKIDSGPYSSYSDPNLPKM